MKYLQVRARPDPDAAPPFFRVVADSHFVTETRLVDWNLGDTDAPTLLYSITGDEGTFREAIAETNLPVEWEVTSIDDERFYCHLRANPPAILESIFEVITAQGAIVVKPVVYRDGVVRVRFVGDSESLQGVVQAVPAVVDLDVQVIGEYRGGDNSPAAALTDRQREALAVAFELGYFEQPRQATHADVADRLGCASSTASEHLQKAQATLVETVLSDV